MRLRLFAAATALLIASLSAHADTLAGTTLGTVLNGVDYYGQSFTVAGSGTYSNITVNYYQSGLQAFAAGTGYIFSSEYDGTVGSLATTTMNLLGKATASNNLWSFAPSLVLSADTFYFFYEDGVNQNTLGLAPYQGGNEYYAASATTGFVEEAGNAKDFLVTGTSVGSSVTPEPSSLALLGTGVLGVIGAARRRFAA